MFKRTESDTLTYLLALMSNVIVLITNIVFSDVLLALIWIEHLHMNSKFLVLAVGLIVILAIDILYRCKLLWWSVENIAEKFREIICELINGPPCSINPRFFENEERHTEVNRARIQPQNHVQRPVVHAIGYFLNINVLCEPL